MSTFLPQSFWDRIQQIYSPEDKKIIEAGFNITSRKTTFRVNTLRTTDERVVNELESLWAKVTKIDILENGYILEGIENKDIMKLDVIQKGWIYLQQISSQIPVQFMDLQEWDKVLDITAAPGSKTSQIAAKLKNTGEIIANEINAIRIEKLKFTLDKQNVKNTKVLKSDARNLWKNIKAVFEVPAEWYFNRILLDGPCSSEGIINAHKEKSFAGWSETMFKRHYRLNKQILEEAIPMLKTGGTFIFSTCTIAPEENESIVHFIMCNYPELELQETTLDYKYARPGMTSFGKSIFKPEMTKTLRVLPSEETEGFFVAKFTKKSI